MLDGGLGGSAATALVCAKVAGVEPPALVAVTTARRVVADVAADLCVAAGGRAGDVGAVIACAVALAPTPRSGTYSTAFTSPGSDVRPLCPAFSLKHGPRCARGAARPCRRPRAPREQVLPALLALCWRLELA